MPIDDLRTSPTIQAEYSEKGWAVLENAVSDEDLKDIMTYLEKRLEDHHPGNIVDAKGQLRAVHGYEKGLIPHVVQRFAELAKRLINCEQVYIYQFRVNSKQPNIDGSGTWKPHRDYDFWRGMDGMHESRAVIFHILINDHTLLNGPLHLCDGSHHIDVEPLVRQEEDWKTGFEENNLKYTLKQSTIDAWSEQSILTGSAGTAAAMHPLTWHYSKANESDEPRVLLSIVFNDLSNINIVADNHKKRPEFIVQSPDYIY